MKRRQIHVLFFAAVSLIYCTPHNSDKALSVNSSYFRFYPKDSSWKSFTVRQKIGQIMLMLPDRKKELELGDGSLKDYLKKYPVTGYFMGWKLYDGVDYKDRFNHIRKACKEYQEASESPLIFQEDYESGLIFQV